MDYKRYEDESDFEYKKRLCIEKIRNKADIEWSEIIEVLGIDVSADHLRKTAYGMVEYDNYINGFSGVATRILSISDLHIPGGNEVRVDTAVYTGYTIPPFYDSMIMKIIVHDKDRRQAINKMKSVLGEVVIDGITTNRDFQYEICNNKRFETGDITTDFIAQEFPDFI